MLNKQNAFRDLPPEYRQISATILMDSRALIDSNNKGILKDGKLYKIVKQIPIPYIFDSKEIYVEEIAYDVP
jgi:hypothetical protein